MPNLRDPLTDAAIEAGVSLGLTRKHDVNEPEADERVGYAPRTVYRGRRESAAVAFLNPIRGRSNLTLVTGVTIDKLLLDSRRAVGVVGEKDGSPVSYRASREVLLSAGALASPAILQRSGIGPAAHLKSLGVEVVADSPNLGGNLREHRAMVMQWKAADKASQNKEYRGARLVKNVLGYYLTGDGPMSAATYEAGAWFKTNPSLERANGQFLIAPFTYDYTGTTVGVEAHGGFQLCAYILRPESTGSILIRSTDPHELAAIVPNYHLLESDRKQMIELVHYARKFVTQSALAGLVSEETRPGPAFESDEEIIAAYDAFGNGAYHASGSCSMGKEDTSVLDAKLQVRGLEGVRVVDTSILPFIVAGNTNGPAMATAWRAADLILDAR
jgi:choline dehydrogenase-like flavoprotein